MQDQSDTPDLPSIRRGDRPRRRFTQEERTKLILSAGMCIFLGALFIRMSFQVNQEYRELAARGVKTVATVGDHHEIVYTGGRRMRGPRHIQELYYDGHREIVDLNEALEIGSTLTVVYLPDDPSTMVMGEHDSSFSELYWNVTNSSSLWVAAPIVVGILFFGAALLSIRLALRR